MQSAVKRDLGANVQIAQLKPGRLYLFQEQILSLLIIDLNAIGDWEIEQAILANDVCLLVIPLGFEHVPFLLYWLGDCCCCGVHLD